MRIDNVLVYNNNIEYIKISFDKYIIHKKQSVNFKSQYLKENDDTYHKIATNTSGSKEKCDFAHMFQIVWRYIDKIVRFWISALENIFKFNIEVR